jgi:Tol biopolymer transport system component
MANEAVSPDGRRVLVKKQSGPRGYWQLLVLDLASRQEVVLNQGPRSVDDQVEWLDDGRVVYHDVTDEGTGIWMLPTDGTTGPSLLVPDAFSPAVQR